MNPNRAEILERWRKKIRNEDPIIGTIAREKGMAQGTAADFVAVHHTARFGATGSASGLLPLGDANAIVMELATEILPSPKTPVLAGVCATDPFRLIKNFLAEIKNAGFSGVQNFPTLSSIDGNFRKHLESSGISFAKETEMIRLAREMDLLAMALVFTADEAEQMVSTGADVIIIQGVFKEKDLDRAAIQLDKTARRIKAVNANIITLCDVPEKTEKAQYISRNCPTIAGFFPLP